MICDYCRREVDYFRGSFWHGDSRICRECFAQWSDPDNDTIGSSDIESVGNYVRLRHGLPPLAAALAILLLNPASTAHAARHCFDHTDAALTWPTRALMKESDGCWTFDHHPPRAEVPIWVPETMMPKREPTLMDRWPHTDLLEVELRELEPEPAPQTKQFKIARHFALFVTLVLATMTVVEVATGRRQRQPSPAPEVRPRTNPVR
jgi:hypothetical protein